MEMKNHLLNLISIMFADGKIADEEMNLLFDIGKKYNFTQDQIMDLVNNWETNIYELPHNFSDRYKKLYELIMMIAADGNIDESEIMILKKIAGKMGFHADVIESVVSNLRRLISNGFQQNVLSESFSQLIKNN